MVRQEITVDIVNIEEVDGHYKVRVRITRDGKTRELDIPKMVKKPHLVRTEVQDDYLVIKFIDDSGEGICSCCILLTDI